MPLSKRKQAEYQMERRARIRAENQPKPVMSDDVPWWDRAGVSVMDDYGITSLDADGQPIYEES